MTRNSLKKIYDKKHAQQSINVWNVKSTQENIKRIFNSVQEHLPDENGRGELDEETGIMRCVEWVIEHLIECGKLKEDK